MHLAVTNHVAIASRGKTAGVDNRRDHHRVGARIDGDENRHHSIALQLIAVIDDSAAEAIEVVAIDVDVFGGDMKIDDIIYAPFRKKSLFEGSF